MQWNAFFCVLKLDLWNNRSVPRILFHLNSISERGTTTAAIEYAMGLHAAGKDVTFGYDLNNSTSHPLFIEKLGEQFPLLPYKDFFEFSHSCSPNFDYAYFLKSGENDNKLIPNIPNYVHVVFQRYEPHGDEYAFVSEWLAEEMRIRHSQSTNNDFKWVPHIVDMPAPKKSLRESLGIPSSAICGIRIGGQDSFDIPFVVDLVVKLAKKRKYYFIFVNTPKFIDLPNVIFLDTIYDKQIKADLLSSADYFLHARSMGESFGISIVEAMQVGIPVFAWNGGVDRNHTRLLPREMLYESAQDLKHKISNCRNFDSSLIQFSSASFRPLVVMSKFLEVFPMS